jgi:hypothetical protein
MSAAAALHLLRSQLDVQRRLGKAEVPVAEFDKWLAGLEELAAKEPATFETVVVERARANNDLVVESLRGRAEQELELLRSLVTTSSNATKTALLINGGAAVTVLAFIGHLVTTGKLASIQAFSWPLACFAGGVFFSALAAGLIYFVQWTFYKQNPVKRPRCLAIVSHALSFLGFVAGCALTLGAFLRLAP